METAEGVGSGHPVVPLAEDDTAFRPPIVLTCAEGRELCAAAVFGRLP